MKKRKIVFDHDDVLFGLVTMFCAYHNETYGTTLSRERITDYDLSQALECNREEVKKRINDFYFSRQHSEIIPIDGAIEIIEALCEEYDLYIVTARPQLIERMTLDKLESYFAGKFKEVHFVNHVGKDEERRTKSEVCMQIGAELVIDDAMHNAIEIAEAGIPVLLLDAPWNQGELAPRIMRVFSWQQIFDEIKERLK